MCFPKSHRAVTGELKVVHWLLAGSTPSHALLPYLRSSYRVMYLYPFFILSTIIIGGQISDRTLHARPNLTCSSKFHALNTAPFTYFLL